MNTLGVVYLHVDELALLEVFTSALSSILPCDSTQEHHFSLRQQPHIQISVRQSHLQNPLFSSAGEECRRHRQGHLIVNRGESIHLTVIRKRYHHLIPSSRPSQLHCEVQMIMQYYYKAMTDISLQIFKANISRTVGDHQQKQKRGIRHKFLCGLPVVIIIFNLGE